MHLPNPIQAYFTATNREAVEAAFAPDAIAHDEGRTHHGPEDIGAWWAESEAKYRPHAEPLDLAEAAGKTVVRARVTGDFTGSPVVLTFRFGLAGDRISDLEIG